jgi:hypothetical protein
MSGTLQTLHTTVTVFATGLQGGDLQPVSSICGVTQSQRFTLLNFKSTRWVGDTGCSFTVVVAGLLSAHRVLAHYRLILQAPTEIIQWQ